MESESPTVDRSEALRGLTTAEFIKLLVTKYPPPIERLRQQVTLESLASPPNLEKFRRLLPVRSHSAYIMFITSLIHADTTGIP
jgi:hypothetical protein